MLKPSNRVNSLKLISCIKKFMNDYNLTVVEFCKLAEISRTSYYKYMQQKPTWIWKVLQIKENIWKNTCDEYGNDGWNFPVDKIL